MHNDQLLMLVIVKSLSMKYNCSGVLALHILGHHSGCMDGWLFFLHFFKNCWLLILIIIVNVNDKFLVFTHPYCLFNSLATIVSAQSVNRRWLKVFSCKDWSRTLLDHSFSFCIAVSFNVSVINESELEDCFYWGWTQLKYLDSCDISWKIYKQYAITKTFCSNNFSKLSITTNWVDPYIKPITLRILFFKSYKGCIVVYVFLRYHIKCDVEGISLFGDTQWNLIIKEMAISYKFSIFIKFFYFIPVLLNCGFNKLITSVINTRVFIKLIVFVFIFIKKHRNKHLQSCLVHKMHGCNTSSNLTRLNMISPLKLAARFDKNKIESSRESYLLDEEKNSIVNIFSEKLLERLLIVCCFLLLSDISRWLLSIWVLSWTTMQCTL